MITSPVVFAQAFSCDGKLYFLRDQTGLGGGAPMLAYIDNYTFAPSVTSVCTFPTKSKRNALGANPIDGYLYFLETTSGVTALIRIDKSCSETVVCPSVNSSALGCFDNKGRFWLVNNSQLMAYDISTCSVVKGPYSVNKVGADVVFNTTDCHFYMGDDAELDVLDTNGVLLHAYVPGFAKKGSYGGIAVGVDGNIYGMTNSSSASTLSKFDPVNQVSDSVYTFSPGTADSTGNDMASFPCGSMKAAFSDSVMGCGPVYIVGFKDVSTGLVDSWKWNFGDGDTSSQRNPIHQYNLPGTYTVTLSVQAGTKCLSIPPSNFFVSVKLNAALSSGIINVTNVKCNGTNTGSVAVNASGGTPPYSYSWSTPLGSGPVASALFAWTYSVTVADARGCSHIDSVIITQPTPLVLNTTSTNVTCNGSANGTAIANCIGGITLYTYLWNTVPPQSSGTAVNLHAGVYTVTLTDANACRSTSSVTITEPPAISVNTFANKVTCKAYCDGSGTVSASSGIPPYTYAWSTSPVQTGMSVTALCAGAYSVTVTDANGCKNINGIVVTEPPGTVLSFAVTDETCGKGNGSARVTATAGKPAYTYLWSYNGVSSDSISKLKAGSYTITVTDASGCSTIAVAGVKNNIDFGMQASFAIDPAVAELFYPIVRFTDESPGAVKWLWTFGDGTSDSITLNPIHQYQDTGTYTTCFSIVNPDSCISSICYKVIIKPSWSFYIPNAFTPEGNGLNETFSGSGTNIFNYQMYIFDRWGNIIFKSNDINSGWDGKANKGREQAQQDVYIYKVIITDAFHIQHQYTGNVTLLK
jgi:gliding motility-associated-like protein